MSWPRYPEYKPSGVEWLDEVPIHWATKPIKSLATCNDEALPESTLIDYELDYVEISDVEYGRGITSTSAMTFGEAPSRARRRVADGDVLISTVRTYLRAIAPVSDPQENLIASTGFAVVRPRSINGTYLGYVLHAEYFVSKVIACSTGVSYPAINASQLMCFFAPVPSLDEQVAIAAFLDRETRKIDALVAEQECLITLLKEKRQAVISHAVTKGLNSDAAMKPSGIEWLGDVPAHWEVVRMAGVFREAVETGSDDLPILSVSIHDGVSDKELNETELNRKVTRSDDRTKYKAVLPGDLAYNMMRAWQGAFGAVTVTGQVSPAYVVARPVREVRTAFVESVLRTPHAVEQMRRHSRGITDFRLRLYWEEFKNIHLALPPIDEQAIILSRIADVTMKFDALTEEAEQAIELLKERRAALISAAVTGQIDVRLSAIEVQT